MHTFRMIVVAMLVYALGALAGSRAQETPRYVTPLRNFTLTMKLQHDTYMARFNGERFVPDPLSWRPDAHMVMPEDRHDHGANLERFRKAFATAYHHTHASMPRASDSCASRHKEVQVTILFSDTLQVIINRWTLHGGSERMNEVMFSYMPAAWRKAYFPRLAIDTNVMSLKDARLAGQIMARTFGMSCHALRAGVRNMRSKDVREVTVRM
jgi:hypothetical protein